MSIATLKKKAVAKYGKLSSQRKYWIFIEQSKTRLQ